MSSSKRAVEAFRVARKDGGDDYVIFWDDKAGLPSEEAIERALREPDERACAATITVARTAKRVTREEPLMFARVLFGEATKAISQGSWRWRAKTRMRGIA